MVNYWLEGLKIAIQPNNLILMLIGTIGGIIVGALPGVTSSMGIILLLPFTYYLDPKSAMLMLAGMYSGSMFGGSISAILLGVPGTPSASATLLDGYPLGKQGKGGKAILTALYASTAGGILSGIVLVFLAPELAKFALRFSPVDYFALSIFGLTIIASVSGRYLVKGLIAGILGLFISTVGVENIRGSTRFTFGIPALTAGFELLPVLIGVFAIAEILLELEQREKEYKIQHTLTSSFLSWEEIKSLLIPILVGAVIGITIGIIPGTGGTIATYLAYNELRRWSKNKQKFGKGAIEGVAVVECANNAVTGGALVPTLALGVPGDVVTAVMLGAMILIGVRPGPLLFQARPDLIYSFFAGWFIIQFMMLGTGFISSLTAPYILKIPKNILMPIVLVFAIIGSFAIRNSLYDVAVAIIFGLIGYFMRKHNFPQAPLVLGVILGPMAETNLNRALILSRNDWSILVRSPISLTLLILSVLSIVFAVISFRKESK
ncbi:MAG: tripartite tricarboxylate transporter permease [Dictyoglomus sp.]|nr:tripartite tricarboxylate transporter permease [Dictyoglomus sp.]MDW8189109.1 tripartite tricarboxylate transporter permease [Dictyoglomus sp.]